MDAEAVAKAFLTGTASIVPKREGCLTLLLRAIKTLGLRQGEALLELDVNAHDSSDAYVSGHGAFPPCAERAEQSGNRLRRKGCDMARKP